MAMDHNLQTIGVVAHGLNQIYPKTHKNMSPKWKKTVVLWPSSGALESDKENFVRRNRIVAGMSEATIVISRQIEVRWSCANMANDYNRDVLRSGRVTDKYSQAATTW
jgi:DNA processing protein